MLHTTPSWDIERPAEPNLWAGQARLCGRFVIGSWYCLDRHTGELVWERSLPKVNYIIGVHEEAILCATMLPGWKLGNGACALRLADGEVIWSEPLSPLSINRNEFQCMDGTIRDVRTGCLIRQQEPPEDSYLGPTSSILNRALLFSAIYKTPVEIIPGVLVSEIWNGGQCRMPNDCSATTPDGTPLWSFSPLDNGWGYGSTFVAAPYIYFLVSRAEPYRYLDGKTTEFIPAKRYLLAVDVRNGMLVQELDLGEWSGSFGLDDVDEDGAVMSFNHNCLIYYSRDPSQ